MKKIFLIFSVFTFAILTTGFAHAAYNECGTDDNEHINQIVALCSTHAYNIGQITNPTNATDKQNMNDVVALKTTIMTQQMKKQYDFLDVTVKRLKTQLEKSILTAKVQAAGGEATDDSTIGKSSNKATPFASAEDCSVSFSNKDTIACLQRNYTKIYNASVNGTRLDINMKKQLVEDIKSVANMTIDGKPVSGIDKCKNIAYSSIDANCMNEIRTALKNANDLLESQERNSKK